MKMGIVKVKLTSADVTAALDRISKSGMVLRNLRVKDGLAAEFRVEKSDLRELNRMVQQHGEQIEIISHEGIYWGIRHLVRRPVMLSGIVFLLFHPFFTGGGQYYGTDKADFRSGRGVRHWIRGKSTGSTQRKDEKCIIASNPKPSMGRDQHGRLRSCNLRS